MHALRIVSEMSLKTAENVTSPRSCTIDTRWNAEAFAWLSSVMRYEVRQYTRTQVG